MATRIVPQRDGQDTPTPPTAPASAWDPDEAPIDFAPGVQLERTGWRDIYTGRIEAMVAAGIVPADLIPGAPGMAKTMHGILPSGELAPRNTQVDNMPGAKSVQRQGKRLTVWVSLTEEERQARKEARHRQAEAADQKERDRRAAMTPEERSDETDADSMRRVPEYFLKRMPKSAKDFRRELLDEIRRDVYRRVNEAARVRPVHGFVIESKSADAIRLSLDAVVEAIMAADVQFDEVRHTGIVHKLQGYLVADGKGAPQQVAQVTKPNPALLAEEGS